MRCKTCDYSLWNITARKCPECGADFKPSDFQFVPNSVRFLCPHCEQDYYGTTEAGHLIPRMFNCVRCSQRIDMDEMLLLPTEGVDESRTAADIMPWLSRGQIGWFPGWIRTVGMAMVSPQRLARTLPGNGDGGAGGAGSVGGAGAAAMFCVITNAVVAGFGMGAFFGVMGLIAATAGDSDAFGMFTAAVLTTLLGGVAVLIIATLWAVLSHGLLKISGETKRGMGGTLQALYYSSGANLPMAVPCLGFYLSWGMWVWWLVSAILLVMHIQNVRGFRATVCVGLVPVAAIAAFVVYIALMIFFVAGRVGAAGPGGPFGGGFGSGYVAMAEAMVVRDALTDYASDHGGAMPGHLVELVAADRLLADDFVVLPFGHDAANVQLPAGGMTLDQFRYLPTNRRNMAAQAEASALPADVIAHRLGDVVFTGHGVPALAVDNGSLWIAVISPDPDQLAAGSPRPSLVVIALDGTLTPINAASMPVMVREQNRLRAAHGLPALPDPATVRNTNPAMRSRPRRRVHHEGRRVRSSQRMRSSISRCDNGAVGPTKITGRSGCVRFIQFMV